MNFSLAPSLTTLFCCLILQVLQPVFGQGHLLLLGEDSQPEQIWTRAAWSWATQDLTDRKVAVLTIERPVFWLPGWFKGLGFEQARNFQLQPNQPLPQAIMDSLETYDIWFFQSQTASELQAMMSIPGLSDLAQETYHRGGLIAGLNRTQSALAHLLLPPRNTRGERRSSWERITPGWYPMLGGKLAVRLDSKAACAILPDGSLRAFGPGLTDLFFQSKWQDLYNAAAPSVKSARLTDGDHATLPLLRMPTMAATGTPLLRNESLAGELLLAGSDDISQNEAIWQYLEANIPKSGAITLISGQDLYRADALRAVLELRGFDHVQLITPSYSATNRRAIDYWINRSQGLIFLGNRADQMLPWLLQDSIGAKVFQKVQSGSCISVFMGKDAQWVNRTYLPDPQQSNRSLPGLGLLRTTLVQVEEADPSPKTLSDLGAAMLADSLEHAVWIPQGSIAHFEVGQDDIILKGIGREPLIWLSGREVPFEHAQLSDPIRYTRMPIHFVQNQGMRVGFPKPIASPRLGIPATRKNLTAYPNPFKERISILAEDLPAGLYHLHLIERNGKLVDLNILEKGPGQSLLHLHAGEISRGEYLLLVFHDTGYLVGQIPLLKL
ncbi:hypothetical protein [Pontibacter sp. G13]|uniref:hypothetical protein n=1 Tax=Pontibacter sp. G13 TaxID=3074898 RepID=UPI0028893980|nr:hypothetical protein [Pontibacter sp. G13]WNJ19422.1 hypothetical protein RJD25_02925 [Pontibacter sp. G13]